VLSLGTIGIALHWLVRDTGSGWLYRLIGRTSLWMRNSIPRSRPRTEGKDVPEGNGEESSSGHSRQQVTVALVALFLVYFVLVFVHELSPYLVLAQLGALAAVGLLRPRWSVLVLAAIAVGYLIPRFTFVNQHFGLLSSIGDFFGNVAPPSTHAGPLAAGARLDQLAAYGLSVGMWLLGILGVYLRWRRGRPVLLLSLLAAMPIAVLVAQPYGGEAILRVYLFSLPWTAALAASAVWELLPAVTWRSAVELAMLMACCLALFSAAFFGDDRIYAMPTTEVKAMQAFYETATPGPTFELNANFPGLLTSRYYLFPELSLTGQYGVISNQSIVRNSGGAIAKALRLSGATYGHPAYLVLAPSVELYGKAEGLDRRGEYADLRESVLTDHQWKRVLERDGILIVELPASV